MVATFITETTCGEACWTAQEDVCRCSCGGRNHGCLRTEAGMQPVRSAKIHGRRFVLAAVGSRRQLHDADHRLIWHAMYLLEEFGIVERKASASEVARWPELAAYRDVPAYDWQGQAYLIWVLEGRSYEPEARS